MIEVILFDEHDNVIDKMDREVAPRIGESINLDCGNTVEVLEVLAINHQWDNQEIVQLKTRRMPQRGCDGEYPPICVYYIGELKPCRYGIVNDIDCPYLDMELE